MDAPLDDHSHGHHHGTGLPWLDIIMGVSAVFISVVSLVVSIQHGKTMEKMVEQNEKLVAASTMPFLSTYGSQLDSATHQRSLHLILKNGGVGPAIVDTFEVRYKGVAYANTGPLLRACCSQALPPDGNTSGILYSNVTGTTLPARETLDFLELDPATPVALQQSVDSARKEMTFSACYCSVLDECWQTDFEATRPKPVPACPKDARGVYW